MVQFPNRVPTHCRDEIAGGVSGSRLQVGLNSQEVVRDSVGDGGLHGMRRKLEKWKIMVGQPRQQPTVIGKSRVLVVMHGPMAPPTIEVAGYPRLLCRGSPPWRGGTVTICSSY